jgi:drug/metabolite transporter (DMT)-like permease
MIAVGFLPGFIALFSAILALKKLTTSVYGTIAYLEPLTVAFFGWLFFSETLTTIQLLGGGIIIIAGILQAVMYRTQ